ncbi:hypothetical protein [Streptomyces graminilatus]|uniref:hypothetical protein n=1 Tax=Streptomyces graminilatus TaxID=1464070 RepID=UPI000B340782|nr:hypothetical protein [Streptomyces graminilatus]
MAQTLTGTGRVTIFPFLHDWSTGSRCVLAYSTTDGGLTAVMGVIPIEGNVFEPGDLFALAGRHGFVGEWKGDHKQRCGCWLACTGYSSRTVRKPGTIDVPNAPWAVDMASTVVMDSSYYGHKSVFAGRFSSVDQDLMTQARALVPVPVPAA